MDGRVEGLPRDEPASRDVFIVFSKSEPTEARFALAIKDGLERMGRFGYEYEHWSWFEQIAKPSETEADVNRTTLRAMLQTALAVVVIPPHGDVATAGVTTELDMLAELRLPILLLRWDYPRDTFEYPGLNVVYSYQVHGNAPNDRWMSAAGGQLGELAWLACIIAELRTKYAPIGQIILDQLPAFGREALTSFHLTTGRVHEDDYLRELEPAAIAASVVLASNEQQLKVLIERCWAEAEPALRFLRKHGHGPVRRPCSALHDAMGAVVEQARHQYPALNEYSADALQRRGIAFTRFGEHANAIEALTKAVDLADRYVSRVYAARAVAHEEQGDLSLALEDMDAAVAAAEDDREEIVHRFTRAVFRAKVKTPDAFRSVLEDYDRILELTAEPSMQLNVLNYRAMTHGQLGEIDAALADWKQVVDRHAEAPRAAAQARLNRAGYLRHLGRLPEADEDLTAVVGWADVSSVQRFRALNARAEVREGLRQFGAAAEDIEALLAMNLADPEWRPELQQKLQSLRETAAP